MQRMIQCVFLIAFCGYISQNTATGEGNQAAKNIQLYKTLYLGMVCKKSIKISREEEFNYIERIQKRIGKKNINT